MTKYRGKHVLRTLYVKNKGLSSNIHGIFSLKTKQNSSSCLFADDKIKFY